MIFERVVLYYRLEEEIERFVAARFYWLDGTVQTYPVDVHGPLGYGLRELERRFNLSFASVTDDIRIQVIE